MNLRVFYLTRRGLSDGYAPSHLTFERNDGIRTGYAPEAKSRTWSSRLYCDGDIPPLYPVSLSFTIINGLPKISEKR